MTRKRLLLSVAAALLLVLAIVVTLVVRERIQRRAVFRPAAGEVRATPPVGIPPVEQWTSTFRHASPDELDALLGAIEVKHPDLYAKWSLGYLHARALVELDEKDRAAAKLAPFLAKGSVFRDHALYQRAQVADDEEASRFRLILITEHPDSTDRDRAIDEELEFLGEEGDPKRLIDFVARVTPSAPTALRREMFARIVETLVKNGQIDDAFTRGVALLRGGTTDDAADRVARSLDRAEVIARLDPQQLALFGDAFQTHRHYDRAIAVLQLALKRLYSDDLQFSLGRSYYGAERFAEAKKAYLRGANATKNASQKATFLWHAARSAQLDGDDASAEQLMTQAIAVKGKWPATTPALTQRLRTRIKQKRYAEAAADLALLKKLAGNERAFLEGSLAYAVGMIAAQRRQAALVTLNAIPPKLMNADDRTEIAHWRGDRRPADGGTAGGPPALPYDFPSFPNIDANDTGALLMAMGLFDDAIPAIERRWPLQPARSALTRAYALYLAGAARPSIYAMEVMMRRYGDVPFARLPPLVRELLYPRYFRNFVAADAERYGVDPALIFAIMREESRFDPRAKSQAAARGLLQFIITTARDIGRDVGLVDLDPEDLYDPRIVINLGAKYMSELGEQFADDRYRIAAAYNAGPKQVALWTRLQPAPGDDYFTTAISFDETKGYVRKVMESYERYQ